MVTPYSFSTNSRRSDSIKHQDQEQNKVGYLYTTAFKQFDSQLTVFADLKHKVTHLPSDLR
jgi:hypothetical protein